MEGYDYSGATASAIKIEDVTSTSDKINREILYKLKKNDPEFVDLWMHNTRVGLPTGVFKHCCYCPEGARDTGWLGFGPSSEG